MTRRRTASGRQRPTRPASRRRGVILLVVFVIISGAALIMTSLSFLGRAEMRSAALVGRTSQAHALAWSGVQAVMAELDRQRQDLLDGRDPQISDNWSLYGTETERGMIYLLPVGLDDELIASESCKLDINMADAASLSRLGDMLTPELAAAIVQARGARQGKRFDSIADLLEVQGITPEMLWGPLDKIQIQRAAADTSDPEAQFERRLRYLDRGVGGPAPRGLADVLTVYSIEPVLQSTGRYRINLNAKYDDGMHRRVARRFGEELAETVRRFRENEPDLVIDQKTWYSLLSQAEMDQGKPDEYIDGFCLDDQRFAQGHVDLNRAPLEVLSALPGMDADLATAVVAARESLSAGERAGVSWLVNSGAMTPEQWIAAAPRLTWRTSAWRVRVLGRVLTGEGDTTEVASECVYEAVIDLSSPQPRVAYLREITMLETVIALRNLVPPAPVQDEDGAAADDENTENAGGISAPAEPPSPFTSRRDASGRLVDPASFDSPDDEGSVSPPAPSPYDGRDESGPPPVDGGNKAPSAPRVKPIGRWTGDR